MLSFSTMRYLRETEQRGMIYWLIRTPVPYNCHPPNFHWTIRCLKTIRVMDMWCSTYCTLYGTVLVARMKQKGLNEWNCASCRIRRLRWKRTKTWILILNLNPDPINRKNSRSGFKELPSKQAYISKEKRQKGYRQMSLSRGSNILLLRRGL